MATTAASRRKPSTMRRIGLPEDVLLNTHHTRSGVCVFSPVLHSACWDRVVSDRGGAKIAPLRARAGEGQKLYEHQAVYSSRLRAPHLRSRAWSKTA